MATWTGWSVDVCGKGGWSAEERGGACELWSFRLRPAYLRTAYNITVLFRVAVCLARAQLGGTTTSRRRWLNQRWVHVVDDRQRRLAGQGGRGAWATESPTRRRRRQGTGDLPDPHLGLRGRPQKASTQARPGTSCATAVPNIQDTNIGTRGRAAPSSGKHLDQGTR